MKAWTRIVAAVGCVGSIASIGSFLGIELGNRQAAKNVVGLVTEMERHLPADQQAAAAPFLEALQQTTRQAVRGGTADRILERRMATPTRVGSDDRMYKGDAARGYDPEPQLDRIRAHVVAIRSADDGRNPAETGLTEAAIRRMANARLLLISASAETTGHGMTGHARWCARELGAWLAGVPPRGT